jgi:hypothetical protein
LLQEAPERRIPFRSLHLPRCRLLPPEAFGAIMKTT